MLSRASAAALVLAILPGALAGCGTADDQEEPTDARAFCEAFTTAPTDGKPADVPSRWMEGVHAAGLPADAPPEVQQGLEVMAELYENRGRPPSGMTKSDQLAMEEFHRYALQECGRAALQLERAGP